MIEIRPVDNDSLLKRAAADINDGDILLFTSRYAVREWNEALRSIGSTWGRNKIVSIGPTTTGELKALGATNIEQTEKDDSYGVIEHFRNISNKHRIVFPRSEIALSIIPDGLRAIGFKVDTITAYKNVMPENPQKVDLNEIGCIIFTSPSTIDNFIKVYGTIPSDIETKTRGRVTEGHLRDVLNGIK